MLLRRFVLRPSRTCGARLLARRGGVTPLAVLSLSLLVGIIALAIDGGSLMEERRHVQAAADAAALAAAADLYSNYPTNQGTDPKGTAQASALANALANGFANDGVQSIVTVNISPSNYQGGPNIRKPLPAGYVEVIIQYNAGRTFSNIFGSGSVPIRGRAVARGVWGPHNNAVLLLNLSASGALSSSSSGAFVINGGLQVNSDSSTALQLSGGPVIASSFNLNTAIGSLAGSVQALLQGLGGVAPAINYGSPLPDPLRVLSDPDPLQLGLPLRATNLHIKNGNKNLYPGVYVGGITVSGGKAILHVNSDGTPGIYFLQGGGLTVSGSASVLMASGETAGVMLYNDWSKSGDAITLSGGGLITLTPPVSGPYQGISIFQKRGTLSTAAPKLTFSGSGAMAVSGTIYAAYAAVNLSGKAGAQVMGGQLIADTLTLSGGADIHIDRGSYPLVNTRSIGLVE